MNETYINNLLRRGDLGLTDYVAYRIESNYYNSILYLTDASSLGRPAYYLKSYATGADGTTRARTEKATIDLLHKKTTLPVAEVFQLYDDSADTYHLLQKEIPGVPLSEALSLLDGAHAVALMEQLVGYLAQIHQITADSFGGVDSALSQRYISWRDCFAQNVRLKLDYAKKHKIVNSLSIQFFEKRLEGHTYDESAAPALIHGDISLGNLLVNPSTFEITGILDFELARFWQPAWELTRVNANMFPDRPDLVDIFFHSYSAATKSDYAEMKRQVDYYKAFESLDFWVWGWGQNQGLTEYIQKDVMRVTGKLTT